MEIMNINGVEYVKREELDKLRAEVKNSLHGINALVNDKPATKKTVKRYLPSKPARVPLNIKKVDEDGYFILSNNRKAKANLKNVAFIKQNRDKLKRYKDVAKIGRKLNLHPVYVEKILYNLDQGTFDLYL